MLGSSASGPVVREDISSERAGDCVKRGLLAAHERLKDQLKTHQRSIVLRSCLLRNLSHAHKSR